ncbi:MAG TPA: hypothetical protein VND65_11160 [Candidatus Binatia bacterium]|nr:hypothetical protein [Candidatus Binatia bacterium]
MRVSVLQTIFASALFAFFSAAPLHAADAGAALLHSNGGVSVNGSEVGTSQPIFAGDVIETRPGFVANLDVEGSSVLIQSESVVRFQGSFLDLEHGSVSVGTSTAMQVHVKCLKVEPVNSDRTQYDVTDRTGTVQVSALKKDVNITHGGAARKTSTASAATQSATVHEGEQASREEAKACGAAAPPESPQHPLNAKWIEIGAGAGGGVLVLCLILCRGTSSSSVSPSQP